MKQFELSKIRYPEVFKQGEANMSALLVEDVADLSNIGFSVKVSTMQPDHGSYSPIYEILVNPYTGQIQEIY